MGIGQALGTARDVASQVADPLELVGDHLDRDHAAQIVGDGRLQGQGAQHGPIDGEVEAIELQVVAPHLGRQLAVALQQGTHGLGEDRLCALAHLGDADQ